MEGVVVNAVNLDWRNLPLSKLLHERYSLPVYALNDSQAAAMGEFAYGGHRGTEENLIVINARHGIGAGLIFGGQLFVGDGGGAGEIGHLVVVHEGGLPCRCGNNGCLETVASVQALIRRVQTERALHDVTLDGLVAAFEQGESLARQVVLDAGRYMGEAIASLVGTLNVQTIVLSGDMTRFGQPWLDEVVRSMRRSALAWQVEHTEIRLGQVGPNSVVLGASALLLRDYSLLFLR
jgi:predicted NBD/HSP70 family sugar kinase